MSEEYRNLNETGDENYLEAYIIWAKTALELNNIIDVLYKQTRVTNNGEMLKQMVEKAYESKNLMLDPEIANAMNRYFKEQLKMGKDE